MSPKRQVNHNIRKHFNTIIYNISRYAEIALSGNSASDRTGRLPADHGGCRYFCYVHGYRIFQHFPFPGFVSGSRRGICKNALPTFRTDSC